MAIAKLVIQISAYAIVAMIFFVLIANKLAPIGSVSSHSAGQPQAATPEPKPGLVRTVPEITEEIVLENTNLSEFTSQLTKIEKESGACTSNYYLYGEVSNAGHGVYNWVRYKIVYLDNGVPVFEESMDKIIQSKFRHGDTVYLKELLKRPDNWTYSIEIPPENCDRAVPVAPSSSFVQLELLDAGFENSIYIK